MAITGARRPTGGGAIVHKAAQDFRCEDCQVEAYAWAYTVGVHPYKRQICASCWASPRIPPMRESEFLRAGPIWLPPASDDYEPETMLTVPEAIVTTDERKARNGRRRVRWDSDNNCWVDVA